jgi:hypothetical protein
MAMMKVVVESDDTAEFQGVKNVLGELAVDAEVVRVNTRSGFIEAA